MNRGRTILVVLSIVSVLCTSGSLAQQGEWQLGHSLSGSPSRPGAQEPDAPQATRPAVQPVSPASALMGSPVVDAQGESLGQIEDVMIDPVTGHVTYAALSHGNTLGLSGKLFAVSWAALTLLPDGKTFVLNTPHETLENVPDLAMDDWPQQPEPMLRNSTRGAGVARAMPAMETSPGALTGAAAIVQEVNTQQDTITVKTAQGDSMELQALAESLADLQVGDVVEVKMIGTRATEIRKKG